MHEKRHYAPERLVAVVRDERHVSVRVDDESGVRERPVRVHTVRLRREVHLLILHLTCKCKPQVMYGYFPTTWVLGCAVKIKSKQQERQFAPHQISKIVGVFS